MKKGGREFKAESRPTLKWETRLGYPNKLIVGIDEVGRGCLAGPVVAGALVLPPVVDYERDPWLREVSDSKCVAAEKRDELVPLIEGWAMSFAVGVASVEEIDSINIFHASHRAMERAAAAAIAKLPGAAPLHALVDGKFLPRGLPCPSSAVIKGDLQCLSIAAASILAKVWRDRHMAELDALYPGYGFAGHKGYATPVHQAALKKLGACPIHRKHFAPVTAQLSLL